MQSYSIAQARNRFAAIVHDVEQLSSVELTRRGKPIAVILSIAEYERLKHGKQEFDDVYSRFRNSIDWTEVDIGPELFDNVRELSPGPEDNPWCDTC